MNESHVMLDVETIEYDIENPRIKMALEKYGDKINAERIYFALRSATEGTTGSSSFASLKDSIRASNGVISSIKVICKDDKYVCIDGNTRLAIYKQLGKEHKDEDWAKIKSVVITGAGQRDIETIRISAHLIGAREWPAYEKARYLHDLRSKKFMDYDEMIAICGGNKTAIERQIDAYHDMNEYYRDVVDDTAFQIDRYSGFVELQKPKIKVAIHESDLELKDFGEWIRDGKIYRLSNVRDLPRVLRDDEARSVFLNGGLRSIEDAIKLLDQRAKEGAGQTNKDITLEAASLHRLATELMQRINDLPYSEVKVMQEKAQEGTTEQINTLEDLSACLQKLLEDVS